jgi:serine/threonine-protein kinase
VSLVFEVKDENQKDEEGEEYTVALKMLKPWLANAAVNWHEICDRFMGEVALIRELNHPHIPAIFDQGEWRTTCWYIMEICTDNLHEWVLPSDFEVPDLLIPIASALQCAHDKGIVHGDVKPKNIFIDDYRDGTYHVCLGDWGSHQKIGVRPATFLGTPAYSAPESHSRHEADPRDDQYSVACVGARLILGLRWDATADLLGLMTRKAVSPGFPLVVKEAYIRALSSKREARYASMRAFAEAALVPVARSNAKKWWRERSQPVGWVDVMMSAILILAVMGIIIALAKWL